jgi:hypothetical protein
MTEMKGEGMNDAPSLRESPRPSPDVWLHSGEYLPPFMRDFHDQKDLFRALQEVVETSNAKHGNILSVTWTDAHIYTVDVFLWCLARRGWTLQRSRKPLEFADLDAFISEARERRHAVSAAVLREAFASNRKDGSSPNPESNSQ